MTKIVSSLAATAGLVALVGAATPAGAAAFVSFVSGSGTDTGDCGTPATVCRQITYALTQTNEGGIIHVLPGEYNAFPVSTHLSKSSPMPGRRASSAQSLLETRESR